VIGGIRQALSSPASPSNVPALGALALDLPARRA